MNGAEAVFLFFLGVLVGAGSVAIYIADTGNLVRTDMLADAGYEVRRHSMTVDGFRTNWVEVVRTDGRKP